jgi:predicted SPOUT superfamily RNA methylase MTH1
VEQAVQQGRRVTLHVGDAPTSRVLTTLTPGDVALEARLAVPSEPRETGGLYWGYSTRIASNMDALFSACPFPVRVLSFAPLGHAFVESFLVASTRGCPVWYLPR